MHVTGVGTMLVGTGYIVCSAEAPACLKWPGFSYVCIQAAASLILHDNAQRLRVQDGLLEEQDVGVIQIPVRHDLLLHRLTDGPRALHSQAPSPMLEPQAQDLNKTLGDETMTAVAVSDHHPLQVLDCHSAACLCLLAYLHAAKGPCVLLVQRTVGV